MKELLTKIKMEFARYLKKEILKPLADLDKRISANAY